MVGFAQFLQFATIIAAPAEPVRHDGDGKPEQDPIIVTGDRGAHEEAVRDLAQSIRGKERYDRPLMRYFAPICPAIVGINPAYTPLIAERIKSRLRQADAPLDERTDCVANALVIFAPDAQVAYRELQTTRPWLFSGESKEETRKRGAKSGPVYAWRTNEVRGADGKKFHDVEMEIGYPPTKKRLKLNYQYQGGRLNQPIRIDINGSVVLIDNRHLAAKTIEQLADYAAFRLATAVEEPETDESNGVSTILTLFSDPENAPSEMSEFDRSFLRALYALRPNAPATAIGDATARALRREVSE